MKYDVFYNNSLNENYLTMFTPGLSRSEEAYFGKDAPLAKDLIKYSKELKDYVGVDNNKFKDKKFQNGLYTILDKFGKAVANDINAEKCQILLAFERNVVNACSYSLQYKSDILKKDKSGIDYIDLDKIADLEDIVITSEGYKYRNSKGKLLAIVINLATVQKCEPETIAAILAHEIGHDFQNGIYGTYKNVADILFEKKIRLIKLSLPFDVLGKDNFITWLFTHSLILKLFYLVMSFLYFPKLLSEGIFSKIGAFIYKKFNGKISSDKTVKMKDQLEKMDNNKKTELNSVGGIKINTVLTTMGGKDGTRQKLLDDLKDDNKVQYKSLIKEKTDLNKESVFNSELKKSKNCIVNFFKSITKDVQLLQDNLLSLLTLSNYTMNTYEKVTFRKKYEYFADIFATSYGFAPSMYKFLNKLDRETDEYDSMYEVGVNKIPFLRALYKTQTYIKNRRILSHDVHNTSQARLSNMYTDLMHELKTNTDLTSKQKEEIMNNVTALKEADDNYYKDRKESGFWFKYYNKLIDDRIKGMNQDTEEYVLKPIEEICKEELKK